MGQNKRSKSMKTRISNPLIWGELPWGLKAVTMEVRARASPMVVGRSEALPPPIEGAKEEDAIAT